MQMTRIFLLINSIAIALFFSVNAFANKNIAPDTTESQKIYDVEIIVFKNKSVPKGSELNLPTPSPTREKHTLDLSSSNSTKKAKKKGFTKLTEKQLTLQDTAYQIKKSSRYDLLTHTGWRQPGLDKTKALSVWIKGGKVFGRGYSSIDQVEPGSNEQQTGTNKVKAANSTNVLYELEGKITVTLSRYLHTQANLVLRKPATTQNLLERAENQSEGNEIETIEGRRLLNYGLNEQRRMRSKKLHYLDHPQFGMLVLITPYEIPVVEEAALVTDVTPQ